MAYSTRYFGTTGGPSGSDGSDWNNRAPLLVGGTSGTWSGSLTGWNFGLSGSLLAYIGSGTYFPSVALSQTLFASPCGASGQLMFCGCDGSGNAIQPDLGWNSCEPEYDTSQFPVLVTNTNTNCFNLQQNFATARCIYFLGNNITTNVMLRFCNASYCKVHGSTSCNNSNFILHEANSKSYDSIYQFDGTQAGPICGADPFGSRSIFTNTSATAGKNFGNNNAPSIMYKCTGIRAPQNSVLNTSVSQGNLATFWFDNTMFDCGATMAAFSLTGRNTSLGLIVNNYFADGPVGIDYLSFINGITINNRFRTFTTATFSGTANNLFLFNQLTSGTDAEFVNGTGSTSGDLTISSGATTVWGNDYGVADQQPTGGGNRVGGFFFG